MRRMARRLQVKQRERMKEAMAHTPRHSTPVVPNTPAIQSSLGIVLKDIRHKKQVKQRDRMKEAMAHTPRHRTPVVPNTPAIQSSLGIVL
jgi:protein-L-isoaspartate O-methyltransferase